MPIDLVEFYTHFFIPLIFMNTYCKKPLMDMKNKIKM